MNLAIHVFNNDMWQLSHDFMYILKNTWWFSKLHLATEKGGKDGVTIARVNGF